MKKILGVTLLTVVAAASLAFLTTARAQEKERIGTDPHVGAPLHVTQDAVEEGQILPDAEVGGDLRAPQLSEAERNALRERLLDLRERLDERVDNDPAISPAILSESLGLRSSLSELVTAPDAVPETELEESTDHTAEFHTPPPVSALFIGRNNFNDRAAIPGVGSTLAEPAAANDGRHCFYVGNTHAEFSTDGCAPGTFTNVPLPAGPASAPFACCDLYVVHDDARRVTLYVLLYLNASVTDGAVRIFVRRDIPAANNCSFTINVGANIIPDYPKLALSNNFLYLSTNNVSVNASVSSQVRRFNIDQMVDCLPTAFQTFTYTGQPLFFTGQRVFRPVEGAWETMYWGSVEIANIVGSTLFRVFRWPEAANANMVTSSFHLLPTVSNFVNPDCRGGVNNRDWIERSTAFSITGFRLVGAVGKHGNDVDRDTLTTPRNEGRLTFYWNVGPDAAHTQGHVHAASFEESTLVLRNEPHIFNNAVCFGYPAVSANKRGGLGLSIGAGGRAGGGGPAVQGFVGVDDDFTPGYGFFQTVFLTAFGTHNPANQRYGDYFTVHPHEPCEKFYNATNYALLNGTGTANVNARYIEFGRARDRLCYAAYSEAVPFAGHPE